ncbi:MAG TPA: 16S rRNA (cytosine(1402)-N(4))-methyltransferase RsmH [Candidatus Saccharibacteria bacterium]|nr:16S rRNA (cytosine(1402)-N(4))-methyltransferase RsmH [Candidatus Saccharibacteria bacterium]
MKTKITKDHQIHTPVLLNEVLSYLNPSQGESFLDLTAGYGGHSGEVLKRTLSYEDTILVDRDQTAINYLNDKFSQKNAVIIKDDYLSASTRLYRDQKKFDMILADLGVSSEHFDNKERGFSFMEDAPLDMRMDQSADFTASDIVNNYKEAEIVKILKEYGDEKYAKRIANKIVKNRPINSTIELVKLIESAVPRAGYRKINPATKTFQALRIAVNDEIESLKKSLPIWVELLKPDGRLVVISFHSIEDRIVKRFLNIEGKSGFESRVKILTKKPVSASSQELVSNPRARSAKLRAAVKIKIQEGAS